MSPTVKVDIVARIDDEVTLELYSATCTQPDYPIQIARLLRAAADELERRPQP